MIKFNIKSVSHFYVTDRYFFVFRDQSTHEMSRFIRLVFLKVNITSNLIRFRWFNFENKITQPF